MGEDGSEAQEGDEPELNREELLALNPFDLPNFSKRKIRYMAVFDVEKWASELEGLTFPTASARVAWDEAWAVQHFYQEGCCGHRGKVSAEDREALERLRAKVRRLLEELSQRCTGCQAFFVRMGPRSPKDAPMMASEPWGVSEQRLRAALAEARAPPPAPGGAGAHEMLRHFQTVCSGLLRATSADEALALLLSSSRVMEDVSHTLDHGEESWDMSVVARAWDSDVRLEREFRTFVVGGAITAISQYDDQLCYDFIVRHREEIVAAILGAMHRLLPGLQRLGLASPRSVVVADFAAVPVDGRGEGGGGLTAKLVELNPFGPMTGAGLFSWADDRRKLQGGEDIFGDLAAHELRHSPESRRPMAEWVDEQIVEGVPFRYLSAHPPGFTWDHLEAFWPDYLRLLRSGQRE